MAEEAQRVGAVLEVTRPRELLPRALERAERYGTVAPMAQREAKRAVADGLEAPLPAALSLEQALLCQLYASEDAREGIAAFLDKRDPAFKGA
jgi:enoyl-CoA hydratase/carnithine racemase